MCALNYFTEAKGRDWSCSACGWNGSFNATSTELFNDLFETNCPSCGARLAIVLYPTQEDILVAAEKGDTEAQSMLDRVAFADEWAKDQKRSRRNLKRLPKIEGDSLEFSLIPSASRDWMNPEWLILLCNGEEIYREPSGFEHWQAIIEIGEAVCEQYAGRIAWIDPADAGTALLGDNLRADGHIQAFLDKAGISPPTGPWATKTTT